MRDLRPILLVEDSPKDAELTLAALSRCQLLNDVIHAVSYTHLTLPTTPYV